MSKYGSIVCVIIVFVSFVALGNNANASDYPAVHLNITSMEETPNGFVIKGNVVADGPHDRQGIYDVYYLEVDIIIKNDSNARYPNFKEWAYEPESIAYYYPAAETRFVPGSGPGNTMTEEEAYGRNVSTILLFSSNELGSFNFNATIPLSYGGKEFRIQATLNWDFTSVSAYWWAHRYVNDIGCEGVLGENFEFLYSDGVEFTYPDGRVDEKFSWKANWPTEGEIYFKFTEDDSYLALWGASLHGDDSVSGKITKDELVIRKNPGKPLEYVSLGEQYLIAGEGEVSIVPEIYDKNGSLILKGWGNLTDDVPAEEWKNWTQGLKYLTEKTANYVWKHKVDIAGGIFIKVTTGVPGFVLTMPTKYVAKALGYLSVPPSEGEKEEIRKALNAYSQSCQHYGYVKTGYGGFVHYCKLYVISNDSQMDVYLVDGSATLQSKNESMNITSGQYATILSNGSITMPEPFDEEEIKEMTGLTMETLWEAKEIEVKEYVLCKKLNEYDEPVEVTNNFSSKDTVYVWMGLFNASRGDKIKVVFDGPNNISQTLNYTLNWSGNGYYYAWLSLSHYGNDAIGQWKTTAYINGEKIRVAYFNVKVEKNTPGFGFVAAILAILFIWKRYNNT